MCQHMLSWAIQATKGCGRDLLELYCGNGNFTVALSSNFECAFCCIPFPVHDL